MSGDTGRAFNSPPGSSRKGRLANAGKQQSRIRCTVVDENGEECGAFPSWIVSTNERERACEKHLKEARSGKSVRS